MCKKSNKSQSMWIQFIHTHITTEWTSWREQSGSIMLKRQNLSRELSPCAHMKIYAIYVHEICWLQYCIIEKFFS